jgi:hypothetical protein
MGKISDALKSKISRVPINSTLLVKILVDFRPFVPVKTLEEQRDTFLKHIERVEKYLQNNRCVVVNRAWITNTIAVNVPVDKLETVCYELANEYSEVLLVDLPKKIKREQHS